MIDDCLLRSARDERVGAPLRTLSEAALGKTVSSVLNTTKFVSGTNETHLTGPAGRQRWELFVRLSWNWPDGCDDYSKRESFVEKKQDNEIGFVLFEKLAMLFQILAPSLIRLAAEIRTGVCSRAASWR